jgi:4-hydroxy-tetrahydrodipicolinate reductase
VTDRYRVAQWATGNIGTRAMRAVIEHPAMDLVGVWVHSDEKAGRDAGELCGVAPIGVRATRDLDEICALGADCVLYMPQGCDFDVVSRLLSSGANVVTTRGEFHRPASLELAVRAQVEAACEVGGTSIHGTGSSPGFITEAVPLVLSSLQRRLDRVVIDEFADLSRRPSPELLFTLMGFGRSPSTFDAGRWAHGAASFGPSLSMLAESLCLPLDSVESSGEVAVATQTTTIAAGTIEAGTVAAQRMVVSGMRGGQPLLQFRANWYCTTELDPVWELGSTGWRVVVDGDTPLDVDLRIDVPIERMGELSPNFTANRAVNAVPAVCAARAGIRTSVELPQIVPILG